MILAEAINGIYFTNIFERKESVGGGRGEEGDFGCQRMLKNVKD